MFINNNYTVAMYVVLASKYATIDILYFYVIIYTNLFQVGGVNMVIIWLG
jgi:hypothetical protein